MNMRPLLLLTVAVASLLATARAEDGTATNPHPLPDDLVLPMPGGLQMVFRPVYLGVGDGPFALREFFMGGGTGQGGYRETPTKVQIGGSFLGMHAGRKDWLYYLGKYEVTQAQYAALMRTDTASLASPATPDARPQVDVTRFNVEDFLERYNQWLFAQARAAVPTLDGKPGFVRLPTEAEWEFAARGGTAVDAAAFDTRHPYGEGADLARYEWFAGPRSSVGKLKPVGLLQPNPLGLYDMLGNAAEMVAQFYQLEYLQGRSGGLIVRGGSFRSEEGELRSSQRTELPPYAADLQPARADTIGFRLVLATPVFTSLNATRQMEAAYADYAKTRLAPTATGTNAAPLAQQTGAGIQDADTALDKLSAELNREKNASDTALAELNLARAAFSDIQAKVDRGEAQMAEAGVVLSSVSADLIASSAGKLAIYKQWQASGKPLTPADQRFIDDQQHNLADAVSRYEMSLRLLLQVRPMAAAAAYENWIAQLDARKIQSQAAATRVAKGHCAEFARTKRLEMDRWIVELQNAGKTDTRSFR